MNHSASIPQTECCRPILRRFNSSDLTYTPRPGAYPSHDRPLSQSLCRRFCISRPYLDLIVRHTSACSMPNSESVWGGDTPRLGERAPLTQGDGAVSAVIGIPASLNVGRCRHGWTDEHVHKGDGGSTRDAPIVPQETRATGSCTNRVTSS